MFERFNYAVTGKKIFGTDGVRGVANVEPVTAETALKPGPRRGARLHAAESAHDSGGTPPKIVLGQGYAAVRLHAGECARRGRDVPRRRRPAHRAVALAGVAYITRSLRADAGIVLSASHNPYEDNGIKFFRHDGYKLDDDIEKRIEDLVFSGEIESIRPTAGKIGRATRIDDALGRYVEFAKTSFPRGLTLEGLRVCGGCGEWRRLQIDAVHSA